MGSGCARVSSWWGSRYDANLLVDPAVPSSAIDYLPSFCGARYPSLGYTPTQRKEKNVGGGPVPSTLIRLVSTDKPPI